MHVISGSTVNRRYRRTTGGRYRSSYSYRPSYYRRSRYGYARRSNRSYYPSSSSYRRRAFRSGRRYRPTYSGSTSTRFDTGKETRVFKNIITSGAAPGGQLDKAVNIWETSDWTAIPTTFGGNRSFPLIMQFVLGAKKAAEWLDNWIYVEFKALYLSIELHNCIGIYLNSIPSQKVLVTGDAPGMPTIGVYWDNWRSSEGQTTNYPSSDRAFSEQQGVKFVMKGKPCTFSWHQPRVLQGRKSYTSYVCDTATLTTLTLDTVFSQFGDDGRFNGVGNIMTRLFDQELFDWTGGYTSRFSLAIKVSLYCKLTGSKKYRETSLLKQSEAIPVQKYVMCLYLLFILYYL